jgi:cytochrome c2
MAGSLVGNSLFRIRVQENRAIFTEQIRVGSRIRAVHQHTNGRLALWTDDRQLLILTVSDRGLVFDHIGEIVASLDGTETRKRAIAGQIDACAECHSFDLIATDTAPALGQVFGHAVAGREFQGYSEGLRAHGGQWTAEALAAFLDDPNGWAPGTAMPDPNITDPDVLAGVVEVLRRIESDPE